MVLDILRPGFSSCVMDNHRILTSFQHLLLILPIIVQRLFPEMPMLKIKFNGKHVKEELVQELRDKYVCPKCGRYFGPQDYEVLIRQTFACPKCKSRYKV